MEISTISKSIEPGRKVQGAEPNESVDTSCGIQIIPGCKRYKISCLQRFATPKWTLAFLSAVYFFSELAENGLFSVTIPSIEKQFQLRSTESGVIGGMMDLGACLALLVSAFFGSRISKTQWVGRAVFISGIGCFIFAIPYFASPPYTLGEEVSNYCGNVTETDCSDSQVRNFRYVFILGMFLFGIGTEYAPTIGVAFLDENVKQTYSSLYNGIFFCIGGLGPVVGYMLGGATLQVFTDPSRTVAIDETSSLWVGAWWMGYLVAGAGLVIYSLPVLLLPKVLPDTEKARQNREQGKSAVQEHNREKIMYKMMGILTNKVFILVTLSLMMHQTLIYGFLTYAVKLGVDIYQVTESFAAYVLGALGIGSSVLGYIAGGAIVTKFNLKLRGIIRLIFFTSLISFLTVFGFLMQCPEKGFAGDTQTIPGTSSISVSCNLDCGCSTDRYNPVCDDEGITYFSPCHAGCRLQEDESVFSDCGCVGRNTTTVSANKCDKSSCQNLYPTLAVISVCFLSGFLSVTPSIQATIRSVSFDERAMALSIQDLVLISGRLVGRVLFSQCLDSACLVSSTECGQRGACRLYRKSFVLRNITMLMASGKFIGVVAIGLAWISLKRKDKRDENETAEKTSPDSPSLQQKVLKAESASDSRTTVL